MRALAPAPDTQTQWLRRLRRTFEKAPPLCPCSLQFPKREASVSAPHPWSRPGGSLTARHPRPHRHKPTGTVNLPNIGRAKTFTQERFFGDGERAWLRNRAGQHLIRSRHGVTLKDAVIWVSSTFTATPAEQARVERLRSRVRLLRYGSDCYAYAMVASGLIDAVVDKGLEIDDIAAQIPLISGAGGACDWPRWRASTSLERHHRCGRSGPCRGNPRSTCLKGPP